MTLRDFESVMRYLHNRCISKPTNVLERFTDVLAVYFSYPPIDPRCDQSICLGLVAIRSIQLSEVQIPHLAQGRLSLFALVRLGKRVVGLRQGRFVRLSPENGSRLCFAGEADFPYPRPGTRSILAFTSSGVQAEPYSITIRSSMPYRECRRELYRMRFRQSADERV